MATELKRCPRCPSSAPKKPITEYYSNGYCKECMAEYSRIKNKDRIYTPRKPKVEKDMPTAKPSRKGRPITITVPGKPRATRSLRTPYSDLIKPPVITGRPETVDEFLARGGSIKHVPVGVVADRA